MHAVVVGGGIGGLGAAAGLHRVGWRVTVLEQAEKFGDVGAGISLWPNALRCLDELGVDLGGSLAPQRDGGFRDRRGRRITRWDSAAFERRHGRPLGAIHRRDLVKALTEAVPAESLRTGTEVTEVREDGLVRFDGGEIEADLVVAADGIRSRVRRALFPHHPEPVYSGSAAFRGVAKLPHTRLGTSFDRGTEVGVLPLTGDDVYWWICYVTEPGRNPCTPDFGAWHDPIPALIDATPPEALLHHDLYHLGTPLPTYTRGRIALLGDAAHAMPPFLGQGGCQALEDAVVLAHAVSTKDLTQAIRSYDEERRPRSQKVARESVRMGKLGAQLANPVAIALRTAVLRMLPANATARAGAAITGWRPPRLPRPVPPRTP
ncbi:2-polyprenyl-6-methoxyphenol hydroxylase-like FAD-dependent oxidoreductase [Amycolatopsis lexingtonensis]|uniref:2-polyprenyl-6-methoxyphenol hydroxylase-like FAD-dependent oxidoreductase n=1 Tax=Amycolatopsis lexingtonensis TaxID=218822 RepID=A0ABR9I5B7_9PSEU|nr:FAD-dependent monooxygenase [Amycolatopsis lexingtonensis]MBE1498362.1 2-polyprenyl-6-methoxyphenol hydroxylase-like FAD-dependent oxidoreductase [Amycolatopsis lexingtonensis]